MPSTQLIPERESPAPGDGPHEAQSPARPKAKGTVPQPIPKKIGRYRILALLGAGAFGVVYKAHDPKLDRDIALKTLKPSEEEAASTWIRRFRQEARAAAKLRHNGVVQVYDCGTSKRLAYLTMEFIDGTSFAVWLRERGMSPCCDTWLRLGLTPATPEERAARLPLTLAILWGIADALGYAHERGIVHRDIKPQNILIDRGGRPHIADFGLARDVSKSSSITGSREVMGTPRYMSPEQFRGEARDATAASDVFALGVMLYEILTGQLPFNGESIFLLGQAVVSEAPERPSIIEPGTPADLERICLKALEKDPPARYATARDLAHELKRYLSNRSGLSRGARGGVLASPGVTAPASRPTSQWACPACGGPMVRRKGKFGPFLGCSNYPRCRGTRPIEE